MGRVGASQSTDSQVSTIHNAIREFLNHTRSTQPTPTATSYHQAMAVFTKFLATNLQINEHTEPISSLQFDNFAAFLTFLQEKYSAETEHSYWRAITAFIAASIANNSLDESLHKKLHALAQNTRRKKQKSSHEIPFDTVTQLREYMLALTAPSSVADTAIQRERLQFMRDKALIFTIIDTGLKSSETTALRIKSFDHQAQSILFGGMQLPIEETTSRAITDYLRERSKLDQGQTTAAYPELVLFARHDKRASSKILAISRWTVVNIINHWTKIATSENPDNAQAITPSLLRHHFVAATLASTDDIQITQQRARHKDKGTTRNYLRQRNPPAVD